MRELVKLHFKGTDIVDHHISSYNNFLATEDNPESRMQKIVDDIRVTDDAPRGIIPLDADKVKIEKGGETPSYAIRVGRRRLSDGKIDPTDGPTIRIEAPKVKEANGSEHLLTPMEARLRNLNYMSPVYVRYTILENDVEIKEDWVHVGDLPMMVKSKGCNLDRDQVNRHECEDRAPFTDEEYMQYLVAQKEDPREPGGYFIIGGTERVLITLEDLAPNRIMVEHSEKYNNAVEAAKVFSTKEGYRALALVEKKKDGAIMVNVPVATSAIPIVALMKALGMESDADIFKAIVPDSDAGRAMTGIVYANIEASLDKKTYQPNGFHTTEDAILYFERNFAAGQAKEYRNKKIEGILDRSLLPHLGDTKDPEVRLKKAKFLGRIARAVLELSLGARDVDDKDHYANKRLKLAGDLMEDLFRTSFGSLMKDLKYQLERNSGRKKGVEINVESSVRPDLLTHKLLHALATGNWVGGRAGVSQLLDRTSNLSSMSHLRRVTSSLTRSQPHFEARDLHPTQWGRLCPSETPEGQNCGLVKNAALIINVSENYSEDDLADLLFSDYDMRKVDEPGVFVYINGNFVGTYPSEGARDFVDSLRSARRMGRLDGNINIRFNEEMEEIIINSDEGRLRRPLLIVQDGKTVLNKSHMDSIRDGKTTWNDLFTDGVLEWIDAEEEEDCYIAVDPYNVPTRCKLCGHALSPTDVEWQNPGELGDAQLKCRYCEGVFGVGSKLVTAHTHMEVDPMTIIGVIAGIVPYPEHNSAPRITMGAAMGKQALGIPTSNYRIRPDTRGHIMHYPQVPMVQTQAMEFMGYSHRPAGQNFCIAVLSYHGYNIEDALVMNKSSVQRGLGRSSFMRSYRSEERKYPGGQEDKFEIPNADIMGVRQEQAYYSLDEDGLINPETRVEGSHVIIGKTSPPRFQEEATDFLSAQKRRETSVTIRPGEEGYVDSVMITESENGSRLVRVKVRDQRIPELGDKFCSRFGQKGVVGRMVDQCDMPFTAAGVTPDLVVNPHGIPSRMTIGHVLEMIAGKVGSMEGRIIDGTAFSGEREDSIRDGLERNGFARSGKEIMYDGRTGRMIQADVYTGVIFYEKLHHMVSGKMHVRSRGPVQILTRQPTEGRSRQGGLRFGEMERDCLIGHGVAMVIKDRLLDESDGTQQYVCGNPECGHIAIKDRNGQLYCPVCKNNTSVYLVQTSYAFKLLMDELLSLGVAMRLQLEDLS